MAFYQAPPSLPHPIDGDTLFRGWLGRHLPADVLASIEPDLREVAAIAQELSAHKLADPKEEPRIVPWDAWGNRVDRIELSSLWKRAQKIAAERGVVGTAYERFATDDGVGKNDVSAELDVVRQRDGVGCSAHQASSSFSLRTRARYVVRGRTLSSCSSS